MASPGCGTRDSGLETRYPARFFASRVPSPASRSRSCLRLRAADQVLELQQELVDILELPVDGGEADVGNLVQLPEPVHDEGADLRRRDLPLFAVVQAAFDLVHDGVETGGRHRTLLAGLHQPGVQLLAIEALPPPILLHDHVGDLLDRLVGGEAPPAADAFPTPANDFSFATLARIDDPIVPGAAKRTFHAGRDSGLGTRDSGGTSISSPVLAFPSTLASPLALSRVPRPASRV